MSITIRSAQTIRNGLTLQGNSPIPNHVTDGLLLYLDSRIPTSWPGSGTTWYDLSGHGNNATFYANPTGNDSILGNYPQRPQYIRPYTCRSQAGYDNSRRMDSWRNYAKYI